MLNILEIKNTVLLKDPVESIGHSLCTDLYYYSLCPMFYVYFIIDNNKPLCRYVHCGQIDIQAGAELGLAQLKLGLGLN